MELEEIFTSPVTTPTTCYSSGARAMSGTTVTVRDLKLGEDRSTTDTRTTVTKTTIRFATEKHILGLTCAATLPLGDRRRGCRIPKIVQSSVAVIPKDSPHLICVGYSEWEDDDDEGEGREEENEDQTGIPQATRVAGHLQSTGSEDDNTISTPPVPSSQSLLQAIAMIDPTLIDDDHYSFRDETSAITLYHPPRHQHPHHDQGGGGGGITSRGTDDVASVVDSAADASQSITVSSVAHSVRTVPTRNTSNASVGATTAVTVASTTATGTSTGSSSTGTPPPHHQKTRSDLSVGSNLSFPETNIGATNSNLINLPNTTNIIIDVNEHVPQTSSTSGGHDGVVDPTQRRAAKAQLILQGQHHPSQTRLTAHHEAVDAEPGRPTSENILHSSAQLDFRPLCPRVAKWGQGSGGTWDRDSTNHTGNDRPPASTNTITVGIWVGSADDALLRFYVPSTTDPRSLQSVPLPEGHFAVETPVLALDFQSVHWRDLKKTDAADVPSSHGTVMHTLIAACQDGTIQLISWTGEGLLFDNITSSKVIVDGPLVCVRLNFYSEASLLRAVIGSLCGYACQLTYDRRTSAWEGPFMIAEGFWNPVIETEDSVLAVDIWENYVALGTHAGRCFLYATRDSENYVKVWQVVLPYSIHGIRIIRDSIDGGDGGISSRDQPLAMSLAVTTRRSFHLFQVVQGHVPWLIKPSSKRYSPDLARERLLKILQGVRQENEEADARINSLVQETIDCVLETVEAMVQVRQQSDDTSSGDASNYVPDSSGDQQDRDARLGSNDKTRPIVDRLDTDEAGAVATPKAPQLEYSSSEDEDEATTEIHRAADDEPVQEETIVFIEDTSHSTSTNNSTESHGDNNAEDDYVLVEAESKDFGNKSE